MKKFVKVFLMLSSFSSLVSAVSQAFEIKLGDPFGNGIGSGEGDSKIRS
ncbi:hypothetical protein NWQ33_03260 [Mycoplasmopsis cynos]|nr:hypothetical protein [Mycoplasmopsis cynos]